MKTTPIEKLLEECEMLSAEGDWNSIITKTDLILNDDFENIEALSYKAMALYSLEDYEGALEIIDRILERNRGDKYYRYFKIRALAKSGRAPMAYDLYKIMNDEDPDRESVEILAHELITQEEYEKALECLDRLSENDSPLNCRIIDGYKRIKRHSDIDMSGRLDERYCMKWISMIRYMTDDEICPLCGAKLDSTSSVCEGCGEEILMSPQKTHIECDDIHLYYYICDKLAAVKEFLKRRASLRELHGEMDALSDREFDTFIMRLKEIGFVVEASEGYIFDSDRMKTYCDPGKYAAPRWLAFPGFTAWTIGWRMGVGEDYCMNEPPRDREFGKLFPRPENWRFNPGNPKFKKLGRIPFLSMIWDEDLSPKYSEIGDDAVEVNDFITPSDECEFRIDALHFSSIEHAVTYSKIASYNELNPYKVTFEELKNDYNITEEQLVHWNQFRYTVCLNAAYYLFMQDKDLKERLLATGNKSLVYVSDDEWGGDENIFGFALMQVRDEIRRLCENEDLIDWRYTEYIKEAYPYLNHQRDANDMQSPEYMVISSTFNGSSRYVRDVNLDVNLADRYEIGQIITEKGYLDASSRIGGMVTTHRYLILSKYMADFSRFEENTNWGLHVAKRGSNFKVLDIFTHDGKTQILLLQLPEGFEEVFKNRTDVEEEFIEMQRSNFIDDLKKDVIEELAADEWLERCEFPVGMNNEGEFFK